MISPSRVTAAIAEMSKSAGHYEYFFDNLASPDWLVPLHERGFFRDPRAPRVLEDGCQFPFWPESRCLARMARSGAPPDLILRISLDVPDTDNVRVHEDLADIALALPPAMSARFVHSARVWLRARYKLLLPGKLGALMEHLGDGGEVPACLQLARELLQIEAVEGEAALVRFGHKSRPRFDLWDYQEILRKRLPSLCRAGGLRALRILCQQLDRAVSLRVAAMDSMEKPGDLSEIWAASRLHESANHSSNVEDVLVPAVLRCAVFLVTDQLADVRGVVSELEGWEWHIFQRIALEVLARFPDGAPDLVAGRLSDPSTREESALQYEYKILLAAGYPVLHAAVRRRFLAFVEKGPDREAFAARFEGWRGIPPDESEVERYCSVWRRDWLHLVRAHLPSAWKRRYQTMVKEQGESRGPVPAFSTQFSAGLRSPLTEADIAAMSVVDIVVYLRHWVPSEDFEGPCMEGLAEVLTKVVTGHPDKFASEALSFRSLDPTYIRAVVYGFRDALEKGGVFPWDGPLELLDWAVRQKGIPEQRKRGHHADPDWGWARMAAAWLLRDALQSQSNCLPEHLAPAVWSILDVLSEDPNPGTDEEDKDWHTTALNTPRPVALDAVMRYAGWAAKHRQENQTGRTGTGGFALVPEAREKLERHLDPSNDPSPAVWSMLGRWFPFLAQLDCKWAVARRESFFPTAPELVSLRTAAWEAHLFFNRVFPWMFSLLKREYEAAVEALGAVADAGRKPMADPDQQLAHHLVGFYWAGVMGKLPEASVLLSFYEKASDSLRSHITWYVGVSLRHEKGQVAEKYLEPIRALWHWRIEQAKQAADTSQFAEELSRFGWWCCDQGFDEDWVLEQLEVVLQLVGRVDPDHVVAEYLAARASSRPRECVELLRLMVLRDDGQHGILGWTEEAKTILKAAIGSSDEEVRHVGIDLVHRLGAKGHWNLRKLLPP